MYKIIYDNTKYFTINPIFNDRDMIRINNYIRDLNFIWQQSHHKSCFFWEIDVVNSLIIVNGMNNYIVVK